MTIDRTYTPLVVLLAALGAAFFGLEGSYLLDVLTLIGLYSLTIVGLVLLLGQAGQLSLSQGAFMGIAAYFTGYATTTWHWSPLPGILVGAALSIVVAAIIGAVIFRLRGHFLVVATLALLIIYQSVASGWREVTSGTSGMVGLPPLSVGPVAIGTGPGYFALVWTTVVVGIIVALNLIRSGTGRALAALHRDEDGAACLGVDVMRAKLAILCVSAAYAGIAGGLYAHYSQFVAPETFGVVTSFHLVVAAILGGVWSPYGAVIGAFVTILLPDVFAFLQTYKLMIYGLIFVTTMIAFPRGIAGGIQALAERVVPTNRGKSTSLPARPAANRQAVVLRDERTDDRGPTLRIEDLSRRFGGLVAVNEVSFEVRRSRLTALIGPNGSGKTTTLNIISGLLIPSSGRVLFNGEQISGRPVHEVARLGIGRTFQQLRLSGDLTVLENVLLGWHRRSTANMWDNAILDRRSRSDERLARDTALEQLAFVGLVDRAHARADSLSFGQQRQVELARALMMEPTLLLLDEPASGLNPAECDRLGELILDVCARGTGLLLVEHNVNLVMSISDEIVVLDFGRKIGEGSPETIRADAAVRAAYLGEQLVGA